MTGLIERCSNCIKALKLESWDYSDVANNGVVKKELPGYVCLVFASEGVAIHILGGDPDVDHCEMWQVKNEQEGRQDG